MKVSLILTCAGKGLRAGFEKNKLLVKTDNITVIEKTLSQFIKSGVIEEYIVTSGKEDIKELKGILPESVKIVEGGNTRTESVKNGLKAVTGNIVLIHDGARPFISVEVIKNCVNDVKNFGSSVVAVKSKDTVLTANNETVETYVGKDGVYLVQTPQGFFAEELKQAFDKANGENFNDEGSLFSKYIRPAHITEGTAKNVKLTYKEDFDLLKSHGNLFFGTGFDCHKLVEGRKLILGGITIPHTKGLLGHSDADVLTHAVMDAILSGAGLRDIGYYFPDTDDKYKDANSILLLKEVIKMINEKGFSVKSITGCIMAEKPKLLPHIPKIAESLSCALGISVNDVGITATTLEGLGFVGREEGICVYSSAVLIKG